MSRLDALNEDVTEEGREHPFTEALIADLLTRRRDLYRSMESHADAGQDKNLMLAKAARAAEVTNTLRLITGKTE